MADIIQLLPDHIANQIAAGEVIQRPASVVKELTENAIDASATAIKIIIKDAGKSLIQVIDDGAGMSDTDVRMAFERHATSKIRKTDDLFHITTKGFRGEALASIAAIAQVEVVTKKRENELACKLIINGSKIDKQSHVQGNDGTNFSIKNLFYNVPARRKFLKSDPVELKHIIEEVHRIALAHPEVSFSVYHNNNELYRLPSGNLKQRIVAIFGKGYNEKIIPLGEDSDTVKIEGFIVKADAAKRTSGEQYLFVNKRFIKSNYLNHAVKMGFEQLIQSDQYPGYFIFLEIDPACIDVNVHPTKTEVKFDEEKLIYNYIRVCVRHALGKFLVAPTLDFDSDANLISNLSQSGQSHHATILRYENDAARLEKENLKAWESIYQNLNPTKEETLSGRQLTLESDLGIEESVNPQQSSKEPYQIHNCYIMSHVKNGFLLIDQQYAHERIMYEENLKSLQGNKRAIQRELFPMTVDFDVATFVQLQSLIPKLNDLGFDIGEFGHQTIIIHGLPAGLEPGINGQQLIKDIMQAYNENLELQLGIDANMARSLAACACLKRGKSLTIEEMKLLIDQLFSCETPFTSPSGHKTFVKYELEDIRKQFK